MKSEFITDVEQQYEVYCKIAEEYGFIDFNAKKSGFRCTTKSNEFNAGWIAFTGAIAAMREDQQAKIDDLQKRVDALEKAELKLAQVKAIIQNNPKLLESILVKKIKQALKGGGDE